MFKLRERDGLPQPYRCPKPSDWHQFFTCKLQSGNSKETFAKFVARTHRERSAQRDAITVPRHRSYTPFKICCACRVVCPEKKVGHPRAGLAGRARAAGGLPVSAGCCVARQLRVFTGREPGATRAVSGHPEQEKVTRNAPRRTPRSSAPRRGTRSSRASSRRTRRTRGPICMTSRRRFAPVP